MSKYVIHNQNPFDETIGDCVVRSLSQALNIDYRKICQMLGKGFARGKGLVGDATLYDISVFSKKYGLIDPVRFDTPFFDYVYRGKKYSPRSNWQYLKDFADYNTPGKYIVLLRRGDVKTDGSEISREIFKMTFHVIYVDCEKHEYYDNMRNDPGDMIVYGFFSVN